MTGSGGSESRNVTGKQKTAVLEEMAEMWLDSNGGRNVAGLGSRGQLIRKKCGRNTKPRTALVRKHG